MAKIAAKKTENDVIRLIGMQKFPAELEPYTDRIMEDAKTHGWVIVVAKAYCYGVINGKRYERAKRRKS